MIFVVLVIFVLGLIVLFGYKIVYEFNSNIQDNADIPSNAKTASTTLVSYYPGIVDNMFLFMTFGIAIAALALAALVRVHPIFIPLFIVALIVIVVASGVLSNIYQEFANNPLMSTQAGQLTFISNILGLLPFVVAIFGTLLMVVMYKIGGEVP